MNGFTFGRTILDLCAGSGAWSAPYQAAGYHVLRIDLPRDLRLLKRSDLPNQVHGVLAAPPCTEFSRAGAYLWEQKGDRALLDALSVADACLRIILACRPRWWALENPIGRLADYFGEPRLRFDPCDYGDPWTKRTWLWGDFTPPPFSFVRPTLIDPTSKKRSTSSRSITPAGFAAAFFNSNP